MDQKQLDDIESKENILRETEDDFSEPQENEYEAGGTPEVEPLSESELPEADGQSESDLTSEEKLNDVNDIMENNHEDEKVEDTETEKSVNPDDEAASNPSGCCAASNPDEPSAAPEEKKEDTWNTDDNDVKPSSPWKFISGVLLILLVVAIYTNGFNFTGAATVSTSSLTIIDAEDKVLDYVNNNLLQPPFTAAVESSEELDSLFMVILDVAGQKVSSYMTKDGRFFFPQGFDMEAPLDLETQEESETELVEVSVDDDAVLGSEDAPVTVIEFSDFQCPFCKKGWEVMKQVEEKYVESGKVKLVFRDFPLGFHDQAKPAAMAAECAHEQGKFWEFHDMLFENQGSLGLENYKKWAVELGLDSGQFNDCLDTEKYSEEVEKDFADGQAYGVSGTPAFFVNGKLISGAQPFAAFEQAIEEALQESPEEELEEVVEELEEVEEVVEETEEEEEEVVEEEEELVEEVQEPGVKEIKIAAKKWRFDPQIVEVNQGDQVKLIISSEGIDLRFILSELNLEAKILAGETKALEFTAERKGTFEFNCGSYCVEKYGEVQGTALKGELVVN